MNNKLNFFVRKFLKEWLLISTIIATVATSIYLKKLPSYSYSDFEVLLILFLLFIIIKGLENSNFFFIIGKFIEKGKYIPFKLVIITAFLAMFITNDVALLIIVPMTMLLNITNKGFIVILEALAANAGSALTPFGNPQNIFIYYFYHLNFKEFFLSIYPFTLISLIIILPFAFIIKAEKIKNKITQYNQLNKNVFIHLFFLALIITVIFRILPFYFGIAPFLFYLIFQRENLKIDYVLIATFFFFFGFTDNLKAIINITINNSNHIFLFSAISSQFISNVPSALLFSDFTNNWKALLWGVNVGGYGNLVGSLANLIAYRIYVTYNKEKFYALKFTIIGHIMFILMLFLYLIC
jgi:Na+/H+ antiporter NhaD/arsenite permease-like protein